MTDSSNAGRGWSWGKGCAVGCGLAMTAIFLGVTIISVRTCVPLRSAGRDRDRLEARFGRPEAFVPATDGAIPAARIEVFLEVRRALTASCERFAEMLGQMQRVDDLSEVDEPTGSEVAGSSKGLAEVAIGIAPLIGEFFEQRNRALVEAEMGLGEYTYIFALAYRHELLDGLAEGGLFYERGPMAPRVRQALRVMLAHQLDGLAPGDRPEGPDESRQRLEREIRSMADDPHRVPWQDGLPIAIEASLAPHRAALDAAFCPGTAGIALDPDSRRAMFIALY